MFPLIEARERERERENRKVRKNEPRTRYTDRRIER